MLLVFLGEFHEFMVAKHGYTKDLNTFIHGEGKTEGYDGDYNEYIANLRALSNPEVDASLNTFVNQPEYNKWVPVIDLMDEYVSLNPAQAGQFWSSNWTAKSRFKEFMKKTTHGHATAPEVLNRVPAEYYLAESYKISSEDIVLPVPVKDGFEFLGWYDNAAFDGDAIVEIKKGSLGDVELFAKWLEESEPAVGEMVGYDLEDLVLSEVEDDTITFGGEIPWYEEDLSVGRTEGNRVGVKIFAPDDVDLSEVTVLIGGTTYDWLDIKDGPDHFQWWPLVTAAGQEFEATINWNDTDVQVFKIVIAGDAQLVPAPVELLTIAEVLAEPAESEVVFEGVVTGFTAYNANFQNYDKVWIEDATGAITVYRGKFPEDLAIGDKYLVQGNKATFSGLIQVAANSVLTFIDSGNDLIAATDIASYAELDAEVMAKRVNLEEAVVVSVTATGQEMKVEFDEQILTVRSVSNSPADPINALLLTAAVGQKVNLSAIHVDWYNGAQFLPTSVDQIELVPLTDEEKVDLAVADLNELYKNKEFYMETDITLLTESALGVAVTWALDPVGAIEAGKWMTVIEDTEVELTATLVLEDVEKELILYVTVLYLDSNATLPETVTLTYPAGSGTANMTGDNQAAVLGLDETIFSVVGVKGSPSNNIGLNNVGNIRMYYHNTAAGNTLKIDINEAYEILEIKINFDSTVGNFRVIAGSYDETMTGDNYKSKSFEVKGLGVDGFTIQNVNPTNTQVHILSIEITFVEK